MDAKSAQTASRLASVKTVFAKSRAQTTNSAAPIRSVMRVFALKAKRVHPKRPTVMSRLHVPSIVNVTALATVTISPVVIPVPTMLPAALMSAI